MAFPKVINNYNNLKNIFKRLKKARKRFKEAYKYLGFREFLKNALYHRQVEIIIHMKDLNEEAKFCLKNKIEIESLKKMHLHALLDLTFPNDPYAHYDVDEWREWLLTKFTQFFENDCKGFAARLEGNLIGYSWYWNSKMGSAFTFWPEYTIMINMIKIMMKNNDLIGFDLFIDHKNRGDGKAIEFVFKSFFVLRHLGYNRLFGWTYAHNRPAMWTYKVIGYKEVKRIVVRRILIFIVFYGNKPSFDPHGDWYMTWIKKSKRNTVKR